MIDQATHLRQMVGAQRSRQPAPPADLPLIVVSGAREGAGATTAALSMACAIAHLDRRVLLVDSAGDVLDMAGVHRAEHSFADVLAGKCEIEDAIEVGPSGVLLLAGHQPGAKTPALDRRGQRLAGDRLSREAQRDMLNRLEAIRSEVDYIIVNAGSVLSPWVRRLWARARLVVLVSTRDDRSLTSTYALLKKNREQSLGRSISVLVNRCTMRDATDFYARLSRACQQFLKTTVPMLPYLPEDESRPWDGVDSPFRRSAMWLGRAVIDLLLRDGEACTSGAPHHPAGLSS